MPVKDVRLKKKTRKMKGGAFVARGSSGCVFKPALKCKGETVRREGKLSKLMRENYAEDEFQQRTLFEPLNVDQNYFIYPDTICTPETPFNASNEVDKCKLSNLESVDDKDKRILMITDGGKSLYKPTFIKPDNMYQIFASFTNIFRGLIKAHDAGIVHMDVKPQNIVTQPKGPVGPQGSAKFQTRLIDFGLSFKIDTLPALSKIKGGTFENYKIFTSNYSFWAPEVRLVNPDIYLDELIEHDILTQENELSQQYMNVNNVLSRINPSSHKTLINKNYEDYYYTLTGDNLVPHTFFYRDKYLLNYEWYVNTTNKLDKLSIIDRFILIFKKNDIFGLGQSLIDILLNCLKEIAIGYPMLVRDISNKPGPQIEILYHKMTVPDLFSRISLEEALDFYIKQVLPPLAEVLRVSPADV
jgi:serine/threonine protein kinase